MAKKKTPAVQTRKKSTKKAPATKKPARKVAKTSPRKNLAAPRKRLAPLPSVGRLVTSNGINGHEAEPVKLAKSTLTARELRDFKTLLIHKRGEILGDMKSMSRDALNSDSANLSHMPIHMADVGSDNYEQELTLGLVESERRLLHEIDDAIERIAAGTYGVCEVTGKPITKARLNAKPWAKVCIEAARAMERYGGGR